MKGLGHGRGPAQISLRESAVGPWLTCSLQQELLSGLPGSTLWAVHPQGCLGLDTYSFPLEQTV